MSGVSQPLISIQWLRSKQAVYSRERFKSMTDSIYFYLSWSSISFFKYSTFNIHGTCPYNKDNFPPHGGLSRIFTSPMGQFWRKCAALPGVALFKCWHREDASVQVLPHQRTHTKPASRAYQKIPVNTCQGKHALPADCSAGPVPIVQRPKHPA